MVTRLWNPIVNFCIDGSVIDLACQFGVDVASCSASLSLIWHCGICLYFGHHKNTAWNPQLVLRPSSLGLQNVNCKLFPVLNSSAKHWVSWVIPLPSLALIPWASRTTWKTRRRRPPAPEVPGPGGDGWDLWLDEVGWWFDLANEWLKKHIQLSVKAPVCYMHPIVYIGITRHDLHQCISVYQLIATYNISAYLNHGTFCLIPLLLINRIYALVRQNILNPSRLLLVIGFIAIADANLLLLILEGPFSSAWDFSK